ncbi:MAG: PDZ domain-containing protein, partial [Stellaceae bacterium]
VFPGEPAWKAGLREGDKILQIGDVKNPVFRDLQTGVALGDHIDEGVDFVVQRAGVEEPLKLKIFPRRRKLLPQIGMSNGDTCEVLAVAAKRLDDVAPGLSKIKPGDVIVAVNGEPVTEGWQVDRVLSRNVGPVSCAIERTIRDEAQPNDAPRRERVDVELPAIPMRTVGLIMAMGKITAVQQGSPAEAADIRAGDKIKSIGGEEPGDPMRLGRHLADRKEAAAMIVVERDGRDLQKQLDLDLDAVDNTAPDPLLDAENIPIAVPALGVAIEVENRVAHVESGSAAAAAGVKAGDEIVKARLLPADPEIQREKYDVKQPQEKPDELDFEGKRNWPLLFA